MFISEQETSYSPFGNTDVLNGSFIGEVDSIADKIVPIKPLFENYLNKVKNVTIWSDFPDVENKTELESNPKLKPFIDSFYAEQKANQVIADTYMVPINKFIEWGIWIKQQKPPDRRPISYVEEKNWLGYVTNVIVTYNDAERDNWANWMRGEVNKYFDGRDNLLSDIITGFLKVPYSKDWLYQSDFNSVKFPAYLKQIEDKLFMLYNKLETLKSSISGLITELTIKVETATQTAVDIYNFGETYTTLEMKDPETPPSGSGEGSKPPSDNTGKAILSIASVIVASLLLIKGE